jgi:phosphoglycolate phosphatase-like HAD superfamily hydrolase
MAVKTMVKSAVFFKAQNIYMPTLALNGTKFDAALVVFDKDGTLIDFDLLWGLRAARCLSSMVANLERPELATPILRMLGYDPATRKTASNSPMAIYSLQRIGELISAELSRAGIELPYAQDFVGHTVLPCMVEAPTKDLIQPLGDVHGLFHRLNERGIQTTVVTSDDRMPTLKALAILELVDLVAGIVCADDPIANKPDPAAVFHLAHLLRSDPARTVVVGDNPCDLMMGRSAGVGLTVGVLSGNSAHTDLEGYADVIIASIDEIEVI